MGRKVRSKLRAFVGKKSLESNIGLPHSSKL